MQPSKSQHRYPQWVRNTCCLGPVVCLSALTVAMIFGAEINLAVAGSLLLLYRYVIRAVV